MRLIDADAFCGFLREVSTRHHYETLLTKKDRYPTVADVIEEICCDLDGTSLNGFDNAPTIQVCQKYNIEDHFCPTWCEAIKKTSEDLQQTYQKELDKLAKIEQICKEAFSDPETQDINLYRAQALANIYALFIYEKVE